MPEAVLPEFLIHPLRATGYILLLGSVLLLWVPGRKWLAPASLLLALILGLFSQAVAPVGVFLAALFFYITALYYKTPPKLLSFRPAFGALTIAGVAAFSARAFPQFSTWPLATRFRLTEGAAPMSIQLNMSAGIVPFVLLYWQDGLARTRREWIRALKNFAPAIALLTCVLIGSALAIHYVRFEPKFPTLSWIWMAGTVFTACGEEAFFRRLIQNSLIRLFARTKLTRPALAGWLATSILFGLSHFRFGWPFVALATIAGLVYGGVYLRSGRIEASILTHFSVNTLHFLLFTYPSIQR